MRNYHYIFTVSLHTEDPNPSFQISEKYTGFLLPPNKMPKDLHEGDIIEFNVIGRVIRECVLYIRPSSVHDRGVKPFEILLPNDEPKRAKRWHIVLCEGGVIQATGVKIIQELGFWDFILAGIFKIGSPLGHDEEHSSDSMGTSYTPFLVDPECVVGNRDD